MGPLNVSSFKPKFASYLSSGSILPRGSDADVWKQAQDVFSFHHITDLLFRGKEQTLSSKIQDLI